MQSRSKLSAPPSRAAAPPVAATPAPVTEAWRALAHARARGGALAPTRHPTAAALPPRPRPCSLRLGVRSVGVCPCCRAPGASRSTLTALPANGAGFSRQLRAPTWRQTCGAGKPARAAGTHWWSTTAPATTLLRGTRLHRGNELIGCASTMRGSLRSTSAATTALRCRLAARHASSLPRSVVAMLIFLLNLPLRPRRCRAK